MSVCILGSIVLFAVPEDKLPEAARKMKAGMMKGKDKQPPA